MKKENCLKRAWLFVLVLTFLSISVFAVPIPATIERVEIDDQEMTTAAINRLDIERGQEVEVEVRLSSQQHLKNVEVEAFMTGFEFNDVARISDVTPPFDMDVNVSYVKKLQLVLPDDVDEDNYKVRVVVSDRDNDELVRNFNVRIDVPRHALQVEDVLLSPSATIKAGSSLLATIRLDNKGEKDEEDVKVSFSIPGLGVSVSDFVDKIKNDDEEESEELFVRLPRCAQPGVYDARIDVFFEGGHKKISEALPVTVLENEQCAQDNAPQVTISLGSNVESVSSGGTVLFPITFVNTGRQTKSFTVVPQAVSFATVWVTPQSTFLLNSGQVSVVYVSVETNAGAVQGTHGLTLHVTSNGQSVSDIPLGVNVLASASSGWFTMRRALEVGVLGLIALLVLLGVGIVLSKLQSEET